MTDTEKLDSILQELKGFNGTPGLCKRVATLEKTVTWIIRILCLVGGGGGLSAGISKWIGG